MRTNKIIKEKRIKMGRIQEQIANRLGVTSPAVNKWKKGHYLPDIDTFVQLSKLYDVSLNELVSGQRLDGRQLKAQADVNLIGAARGEIFPLRDRTAYWRRKWLAEHRALLIFAALLYYRRPGGLPCRKKANVPPTPGLRKGPCFALCTP